MEKERFAVIDIGSNTARMVFFESTYYTEFKAYQTFRFRLKLRSYLEDHVLSKTGIQKLTEVLTFFQSSLKMYNLKKVYAFATATIRDSKNCEQVLQEVKSCFPHTIQILSKEEEARFGYLSIMYTTSYERGIAVDMGGGSTEVTRFENKQFKDFYSFEFGSLSLFLDYFKENQGCYEQSPKLQEKLFKDLFDKVWLKNSRLPIVAMGGSARALAKIHMTQTAYPLPHVHQYVMSREDIIQLHNQLKSMQVKDLIKFPGVTLERLETLLPSCQFFVTLMDVTESDAFIVSSYGIREGFCYHLTEKEYDGFLPNVKEESVQAIIGDYHINTEYAHQEQKLFYNLSTRLVEAGLVDWNDEFVRLGSYALKLYNLGVFVSDDRSSQHTYYILTNSSLNGFSHLEQIQLALLASFKSRQKMLQYMELYKSLDKKNTKDLIIMGCFIRFVKQLSNQFPNGIQSLVLEKCLNGYVVIAKLKYELKIPIQPEFKVLKTMSKTLKIELDFVIN